MATSCKFPRSAGKAVSKTTGKHTSARRTQPQDTAQAANHSSRAVFLASPVLLSYISGVVLPVMGGPPG